MSQSLKSTRKIITPRLDGITDTKLSQILNDFAKIITQIGQNAYDDLTAISTTAYIDSIYFGSPTLNGSWRIIPSGNNLSVQRRESGSWVEKLAVTP